MAEQKQEKEHKKVSILTLIEIAKDEMKKDLIDRGETNYQTLHGFSPESLLINHANIRAI